MTARFAIDSNVLIYAEGTADMVRRNIAIDIVDAIGPDRILLPMQAAGETVNWLIRKGGLTRPQAVERISWWMDRMRVLPVEVAALRTALRLVERHALQLWDAVILAASAGAGAQCLLSEDMQHGFAWNGVTIVNPFGLSPQQRAALVSVNRLH